MTHINPIYTMNNSDLDISMTKLMIDVLRYTDTEFNGAKITHYFANQIFSTTNVDQIEFITFATKETLAESRHINRDGKKDGKVTSILSQNVRAHDKIVGKVNFNFFGFNKPHPRFAAAIPYVAETMGLIMSRFLERAELQQNQVKTIVSALANDYGNITYMDLVKGEDRIIKANNNGVLVNDDENSVPYIDRLQHYLNEFVVPEEKEEMTKALSIPVVLEKTKEGKPYLVSCRIMINGEVHYRSIKHVPMVEDGKVVSLVIGYQSVDAEHKHQEELEKALEKAEVASKAKTNFLFNMSHDIRTPMNAMIGFTNMAKNHIGDKEKVLDCIAKIDTSSHQLLSLINQILEMSRIESGKVAIENKTFNIVDKIKESSVIFNELCSQKKQTLTVDTSGVKHRNIKTDPERISQIINNLLGNSYKYTQEGGELLVKVSQEDGVGDNKTKTIIVVKDNGMGMSKEYLEHIFEAFTREKSSTVSKIQGTGLGMSIVKSVCDMLGATINIQSEKDKGTEVVIELVCEYDEISSIETSNKEESTDFSIKGLRILVVEDNPLNREIAQEILTEAGAIVDIAEDGDIAIDKVCNSDPGDIDVILMDVQMPRMNGYEATKVIRGMMHRKLAQIPILAMTANAFEEDKKEALEAGMNDHIAKPIDIKKLLNTLSKYMKNPNAEE